MFRSELVLRAVPFAPGFWVLEHPLIWDDPVHGLITVAKGELTDLASVPRIFRNVLDVTGLSRRPAVLHDCLYRHAVTDAGKMLNRKQCDDVFLAALKAEGSSWYARGLYYAGVRAGGWKPWARYRETPLFI